MKKGSSAVRKVDGKVPFRPRQMKKQPSSSLILRNGV